MQNSTETNLSDEQTQKQAEMLYLDNLLITGLANIVAFAVLMNKHKQAESVANQLLNDFKTEFNGRK